MSDGTWSGGLARSCDYVFPARPDDPEMRESTSFWLFEENGEFALPRFGIEAEAANWDQRRVQGNFAFPEGRVLNGAGIGLAHDPVDGGGVAAILGAGPLETRCIEPFRTWEVRWDGEALDGSHAGQVATKLAGAPRSRVRLSARLEMAAPAWVHDYRPDKVAAMTPAQLAEAQFMGLGYRIEQLFTGAGELAIDGATRPFRCRGSRIHRQSVRPLAGFRGHCWQSAVFPDGRAFAYIAYPPHEDGSAGYGEGFVWRDGQWHAARPITVPWLRDVRCEGDDVGLELVAGGETVRIGGRTLLSTFRIGNPDIGGLDLHQGSAWYEWDGQRAMGMIERSSHESLTRVVTI